jgi:hypothetical protein
MVNGGRRNQRVPAQRDQQGRRTQGRQPGFVIGRIAAQPVSTVPALPATSSRRLERGSGILLIVIAVFVVLGIHLPGLVDALRDQPKGSAYLATPTTFWVVKFYDLGIVVPAALTVGVGLLRRQSWARKPAYAILGGYMLLGCSVAGMAWSMSLSGDPDASLPLAIGMTALAGAGAGFAYVLYRPLFLDAPHLALGHGRDVSRGSRPCS